MHDARCAATNSRARDRDRVDAMRSLEYDSTPCARPDARAREAARPWTRAGTVGAWARPGAGTCAGARGRGDDVDRGDAGVGEGVCLSRDSWFVSRAKCEMCGARRCVRVEKFLQRAANARATKAHAWDARDADAVSASGGGGRRRHRQPPRQNSSMNMDAAARKAKATMAPTYASPPFSNSSAFVEGSVRPNMKPHMTRKVIRRV